MRACIRFFILSTILVLGSPLITMAQITSTLGWFEINYNQGCTPLQVSVTTAVSENDVPIFQFNGIDDPNPVAWRDSFDSLSHTYTSPGRYMVYLTVQTNNVIRQDSLEVNVLLSELPVFELKNCSGNGIEVDIQDNFYDRYIVNFGDGTQTTVNSGSPNPTHVYSDTQTYTVAVTGRLNNAPNNCGSLNRAFTPANTILPPFINSVRVDSTNTIELSFTLGQQVDYRLEASAGNATNFQFLQLLDPTESTLSLNGFSPDIQTFCFRIGANDVCNGNFVYSNINCTLSTNLTIVNNVNQLSWNTVEQGSGEESYRIGRNAVTNFLTFPAGTSSFNDQQVNCNTDYCYQVSIQYQNGAQSIAPPVCGTAFSTDIPPAIQNLGVDVRDEGVLLSWPDDPDIDTSFIRQTSPDGTLIEQYSSSTNVTFLPVDLLRYPQTCYQHSYRDVCGNISRLETPVCNILLSGVGNPDGSITLNWTNYSGWVDSVQSYTLEKYSMEGVLFESIQVGLSNSYLDQIDGSTDQIVTYIILATPNDDQLFDIRSNAVNVARRAQLHYPNAFTPDGDGLNDIFKPEYLFIKEYSLNIYNRWGELIFNSSDIDTGWDGLINGEAALEGNYSYLSQAEDFRGLKLSRSGILLLLRK